MYKQFPQKYHKNRRRKQIARERRFLATSLGFYWSCFEDWMYFNVALTNFVLESEDNFSWRCRVIWNKASFGTFVNLWCFNITFAATVICGSPSNVIHRSPGHVMHLSLCLQLVVSNYDCKLFYTGWSVKSSVCYVTWFSSCLANYILWMWYVVWWFNFALI